MNEMLLLGLVKAGACVVVDGTKINPMTLMGLCNAAAGSGGRVIIRNARLLNPMSLQGLANAARAHVELDFTEDPA